MNNLTQHTVVVLEELLKRPEGNVYSLMTYELQTEEQALRKVIQELVSYGINLITFCTTRNVHRIQVNQDDAGIQKYLETKEQRK